MPKVKFTDGQVVRGKAAQAVNEYRERKQENLFVADDKKPKVELRDYFLAAALQGLCASRDFQTTVMDYNRLPSEIVALASKIADEVMLRGR